MGHGYDWKVAAPLEVYPGEPDGDCPHGVLDGMGCPECEMEGLKAEIRELNKECDDYCAAFHAALTRPKGVVSAGYEDLYDQDHPALNCRELSPPQEG